MEMLKVNYLLTETGMRKAPNFLVQCDYDLSKIETISLRNIFAAATTKKQ